MVLLDAVTQAVQRREVGACPAIEYLGPAGKEQQHGRPQITDEHIDSDELAEHRGIDVKDLAHGGLVGTAANP
jgi:hypothetical protein